MSREQLTVAALALPLDEQVELAQTLWENIHNHGMDTPAVDEALLAEVRRRDEELSSGSVQGYAHEEVMAAARQAIGCE